MAPTLVQQVGANQTGTSHTITLPASSVAGNLLVLSYAGDKATGALIMPAGWAVEHQLLSTSVSLYQAWKVSAGEQSVAFSTATARDGDQALLQEFSDVGAGAWGVVAKASHITDENTTNSWDTGVTPAASRDGVAILAVGIDSGSSYINGARKWSANVTPAYSGAESNPHACLEVASANVAAGGTVGGTFSWTGGGVDQLSGSVLVMARASTTAFSGAGALGGSGSVSGAGAGGATRALSGSGTVVGAGTYTQTAYSGSRSLSGTGVVTGLLGGLTFKRAGSVGGGGFVEGYGGSSLSQFLYVTPPIPDYSRKVEWRYMAQNIITGEWLHWDLPLKREELRWDLSGPGSLRGTITPEQDQLRDAAGNLILKEWQTAIYAEANGQIRWGGLVIRTTYSGATLGIEAAGFSTYPHGIPYTGPYYAKIQADPTDIFRAIWTHLQTQPDGDLGMEFILPTDCPVRVGDPAIPGYATYKAPNSNFYWPADKYPGTIIYNAKSTVGAGVATTTKVTLAQLDKFDQIPLPFVANWGMERVKVTARSGRVLTLIRGQEGTSATAHAVTAGFSFTDGTEVEQVETVPAEPYVLAWWEAPDCGTELDQLAAETPFDYSEEHLWNADGTVRHRIRVDYPRLGRKRPELAFVQGENVTKVVELTKNGDDYANGVMGLGKGEGSATLRSETAIRDGRLRRPKVYTDKLAATIARLRALVNGELNRSNLDPELTQITVRDHPNARIGSWNMGDDILVRCELPWIGYVELWCRITSWSLEGEASAVLQLQASSSFTYGAPASVGA